MPDLVALGVQTPKIDTAANFQQAQSTAINQLNAQQQQEAAALEHVAQLGFGVMGGKLDGKIDPERLDTMVSLLGDSPLAAKIKANPELLRTITQGSANVISQAQDAQKFELAKKQFDLELQKLDASIAGQDRWVDLTGPAQRAQHGIQPKDTGLYQVNTATGELKPLGGKGQTINVGGNNDIGTIPAGMMVTRDADGNVTGMQPIPGGPAEKAANDAATQDASRKDITDTGANVVTNDIGRTLDLVNTNPGGTTGWGALLQGWVPGTDAKSVDGFLTTVKANAAFDKLQQMREASPTGGALGQVSDVEERMLTSAIGSLDPTAKPDVFTYNLKRVFNIYQDIINGKSTGQRYDLDKGSKAFGTLVDAAGVKSELPDGGSNKAADGSAGAPKNADETKSVDGKTYYRIGSDWFEAN